MIQRRQFIQVAATLPVLGGLSFRGIAAAPTYGHPRVTFYGAARQVSGSCHLLETSDGLYLIDCGRFVGESDRSERHNRDFPFDPKEVKAVLLTHAHNDHFGRLPMLVKRGFRGKIYCTDATRDLTELGLGSGPSVDDQEDALFDQRDIDRMLEQWEVVPYNRKIAVDKLVVRYTDAGHILGSAMIEVWVDGRKILFSGDMGPDDSPILHAPAIHSGADAVLVESTYGTSRRSHVDYRDFGRKVAEVLERRGDVLIPTFAIHKSQLLIYVLQTLVAQGILPRQTPIYCDSGTVHSANRIYDAYKDYHDLQAVEFVQQHGSLFYSGRYREGRADDFLKAHGGTPSIYIATSGMLAFAASPRHLEAMAGDPNSAVFLPGYQAPGSIGRQLLDGQRRVTLELQSFQRGEPRNRQVPVDVKLEVERIDGFSSHTSGQQILEWASQFNQMGQMFVVHGAEESARKMADKLSEMGLEASAPRGQETFTIKGERVRPGQVPELDDSSSLVPAAVDR